MIVGVYLMEKTDKILELGKNGGLTITGISGAILFQMVSLGELGIPFWVFLGLFVVSISGTGLLSFIKSRGLKKIKIDKDEKILSINDFEDEEAYKDALSLINVLKNNLIDSKSLRLYMENMNNRPSLLDHPLFVSVYHIHKDEIRYLKEIRNSDKSIIEKGRNYLIRFYLTLFLEVSRFRLKTFVKTNEDLIMDNYKHLNPSLIKDVLFNLRGGEINGNEGYNYLAIKKYGFPNIFLSKVNTYSRPYLDDMYNCVEKILNSPYYETDYARYGAVLDTFRNFQESIFSFRFISKIFCINSEFDSYCESVGKELEIGLVKDFSGIDDLEVLKKYLFCGDINENN